MCHIHKQPCIIFLLYKHIDNEFLTTLNFRRFPTTCYAWEIIYLITICLIFGFSVCLFFISLVPCYMQCSFTAMQWWVGRVEDDKTTPGTNWSVKAEGGGAKIKVLLLRYKFHCDLKLENGPVTSHGHTKLITILFFFFNIYAWEIPYVTNLRQRVLDNLCPKARWSHLNKLTMTTKDGNVVEIVAKK